MSNSNEPAVVVCVERPYTERLAFILWGAILYWASLPPMNFWPLAFLVPVVWSVLIGNQKTPRYRWIYLSAFFFWTASIWWIACPHPMTSLGLIALAGYLSIYWPLFILTSRIAVHRLKIPIVLSTPVCWIGCEYLRFHLLGGFSFCSLQHALYLKPKFIQIADLGGEYLVGGMIMLVGTGFAVPLLHALLSTRQSTASTAAQPKGEQASTRQSSKRLPVGLGSSLLAVTVLLLTVLYDSSAFRPRFSDSFELAKGRTVRIAALQGNIPVQLNGDPELPSQTYRQFLDLTRSVAAKAREEGKPLDLIVWPETVCPIPIFEFRHDVGPDDLDEEIALAVETYQGYFQELRQGVEKLDVALLLGLSTLVFQGEEEPLRLNSALLVDPTAVGSMPVETDLRYDKVHLVMFGEYIPFSKYLPKNFFLKTLCQEAGRGTDPVAMPIGMPVAVDPTTDPAVLPKNPGRETFASVNICFESSVPHLIRDQVLTLKKQGKNPTVLINMSNDGWFRFSQQIDQHLATHVFRAVENARPCVTATNGGFAAVIDAKGRIQAIGNREKAEAVVGNVSIEHRAMTLYHRIDDWPAKIGMLSIFCLLAAQMILRRL